MKQFTFMLLLSMLLCEALYSQTLTFYYFDKPAVISANFNTGQVSEEPGFDKVLITAANVATFKRSSPPNLVAVYTKLNNTASPLRKSADRLTTISNTIITNINFNLVNDNTGLTANVAEANQFFCRSYDASTALQVAWPCATNSGSDGSVRFGENAAGRNDFESVVIHEISHTQTLSDAQGFNSRYDKGTNYVRIAYGGDAGHYINELQADQQLPMDEAFGNFWGGVHDPVWRTATIAKFTSNREYLLGSHSLLSGTADMWTAPHSVLVSGVVPAIQPGQAFPFFSANGYTLTLISDNLTTGGSRYEARMYRFCDIPGKYVFNSEMLTELYLHLFHKYSLATPDLGLASITRFAKYYSSPSNHQRHRYPFNMAMFLAADMEKPGSPTSSLFPLALYDLLTHFGMSDDELGRQFKIAGFDLDGLTPIPKSKASLVYFSVRQVLKTSLLQALYNNKDCTAASTVLNVEKSVAALKAYCQLPETLALTR